MSPREIHVLAGIASGLTTWEIANRMGLATGTVRRHTVDLMSKLGASTRAQAVSIAVAAGIDLSTPCGPSRIRSR